MRCRKILNSLAGHMIIWSMRIACWISKATDTLTICNPYCFFTATMVARTGPQYYLPRTVLYFACHVFCCALPSLNARDTVWRLGHDVTDTQIHPSLSISQLLAYSIETTRPLIDYASNNRGSILGRSIFFSSFPQSVHHPPSLVCNG